MRNINTPGLGPYRRRDPHLDPDPHSARSKQRSLVRILLNYQGWMWLEHGQKPSIFVKAWFFGVKMLSGGKPSLYNFQVSRRTTSKILNPSLCILHMLRSLCILNVLRRFKTLAAVGIPPLVLMSAFPPQACLPTLPVPPLRQTVDRYLLSVKPLLKDDEFADMEDKAKKFLKNEAWKLQLFLQVPILPQSFMPLLASPLHPSPSSPAPLPLPLLPTHTHIHTLAYTHTHPFPVHPLTPVPHTPNMQQVRTLYTSSWLWDWWEKYVYLRGRSPIMIGSNYYIMDTLYAKICENQVRPRIPKSQNSRSWHTASRMHPMCSFFHRRAGASLSAAFF